MKGKLAILLLVVVATFAFPSEKETFKIVRSLNNNGSYYFYPWLSYGYAEARLLCQTSTRFPPGTTLAQLETKQEEDFLYRMIEEEGFTGHHLWVGGRSIGNGTFIWESGLPISNDLWLPGEPSHSNELRRVAVNVENGTGGLVTHPGYMARGLICELPA